MWQNAGFPWMHSVVPIGEHGQGWERVKVGCVDGEPGVENCWKRNVCCA